MGKSFYDLEKDEQLSVLRRIFEPGVIEINSISGCHELSKRIYSGSQGYGTIGARIVPNETKLFLIHRIVFEFLKGVKIPDGLCILHECDNPKCINVNHLRVGTHKDNMRDMAKRKRSGVTFGVKNGRAKLTEAQVLEIKKLLLSESSSAKEIAEAYKVSRTTVERIRNGKRWNHVQIPLEA